ncbi:DUF3048 domain-containing protein [Pseudoflavonifractor phocaeensis]|uniref:DUF3048 domain-containing protein n=2 Tax=Pseudoflavonifractor phocaeensis TaxID=1870988 RepID=UPI00195BA779|nr:DUF3048 domain-containing protein [Pseudoflavonifractor phocaeensis]MBM6938304.1 DUF3048 domain-containing protein [Pseudoflavonifractor phocaeensis]
MSCKRILSPVCAALALTLCLSGCGDSQEAAASVTPQPLPTASAAPTLSPTATPDPTPTPYDGPENPLTGMPIDGDAVNKRPVAIMLNNLKQALPQLGQSEADIIYECLAEGGITRMLGVYQDPSDVGAIGSIRSARPYYLELALGHDAIFIHAGGSEDAYADIRAWGVTALDGVNGPYCGSSPGSNLMWRDADRRRNLGYEHSVITTGETIEEKFATYSFRQEHKDGYTYPITFADDGTPENGSTANTITVPFSNYKTGVFTYDADSGTYLVEEYGAPYVDGNTGDQVAVTNVLVVQTSCWNTGDSYGHMEVDLTGTGSGYYACGGQIIPIRWSKPDRNSPFTYTDENGQPIVLGRGSSYVNIIPKSEQVTAE